MRDPGEGRAAAGTITTGVGADRVPAVLRPVLTEAVAAVAALDPAATLAVYGSVATGQAQVPTSDVDLLAVGLPAASAAALGRDLTRRSRSLCREVAVAALPAEHLVARTDAAYGDRVFLRHYAVVLAGPDPARDWPAFPADARAARGFNGDIAAHAARWRELLVAPGPDAPGRVSLRPHAPGPSPGPSPEQAARVGRALARKTLMAVAGLVSVHETTWTTDRGTAARRWAQVRPEHAPALGRLLDWSEGRVVASWSGVEEALDGVVDHVVTAFAQRIGLWR